MKIVEASGRSLRRSLDLDRHLGALSGWDEPALSRTRDGGTGCELLEDAAGSG